MRQIISLTPVLALAALVWHGVRLWRTSVAQDAMIRLILADTKRFQDTAALAVQQDISRAITATLFVTLVSTVLGGLGLLFVYQTLRASRNAIERADQANKIASDAVASAGDANRESQRQFAFQQRAWLDVEPKNLSALQNDNDGPSKASLVFLIHNHGRTVAREICVVSDLSRSLDDEKSVRQRIRTTLIGHHDLRSVQRLGSIFPGTGDPLPSKDIVIDGDMEPYDKVYLTVGVIYQSLTGNTRSLTIKSYTATFCNVSSLDVARNIWKGKMQFQLIETDLIDLPLRPPG